MRHDRLACPIDQAEGEPAWAPGDDEPCLAVPYDGAERDCPVRRRRQRLSLGVHVQVEVAAAGTAGQSLHPQVRVTRWRKQGRELARRTPGG